MKFKNGCLEILILFVGLTLFIGFFFGVIVESTVGTDNLSDNIQALIGFIMIMCILFSVYWYDKIS